MQGKYRIGNTWDNEYSFYGESVASGGLEGNIAGNSLYEVAALGEE